MTAYTYDAAPSRKVTRHFCDTCGTQIMAQSDALGVASVNAMTFEDPSAFHREIAFFSDSALKWCELKLGLTPVGTE